MHMSSSERLYSQAKKCIVAGVNSPVRYFEPYPFFVKNANAGRITDVDGHTYVDLCCAYGALLLGHRNRAVISAVKNQLMRGTLYCAPTPQETVLAELISGNYPSMKRVRLLNTGLEATMSAIRLARAYTKREKIIKFDGSYHGAHDYVLVNAGSGVAHYGLADTKGALRAATQNTKIAKFNNVDSLEGAMSSDVAAIIVEPIMANAGLILPNRGFLKNIIKIAHSHGALVIFDETVTGFRMARGGAQEYYGVRADITTLAKALGGGFGIAALGGRADIMDNIAPKGQVYVASTFAGNPIAVSASIAAIRQMRKLGSSMYSKLERVTGRIVSHIDDIAHDLHIPHTVNTAGSMFQIFLSDTKVQDYTTAKLSDGPSFKKMAASLRQRGVFIPPSQFEVVFLSVAHTDSDIRRTKKAYEYALGRL